MITLIIIDLIVIFLLSIAVEYENDFFALFGTAILIVGTFLLLSLNPIPIILNNAGIILASVFGYMITGGLWAIFKWNSWLSSDKVKDEIAFFKERMSKDSVVEFKDTHEAKKFFPKENTPKILRWIAYWPLSLFYSVTYRLVHRVVKYVYNSIVTILTNISNKHLSN
jgi:hypothetical protein